MFYYDSRINTLEKELKYDSILTYLEKLYFKTKDTDILATLIGYSWYFLIEGDLDNPVEYSWELCLEKWREYILKGESLNISDSLYLFIVGYSLMLHSEYLMEFSEVGKSKISILSNNEHELFAPLAKYLLNSKNYNLNDRKDLILKYFHNDSILDSYFRGIFIK